SMKPHCGRSCSKIMAWTFPAASALWRARFCASALWARSRPTSAWMRYLRRSRRRCNRVSCGILARWEYGRNNSGVLSRQALLETERLKMSSDRENEIFSYTSGFFIILFILSICLGPVLARGEGWRVAYGRIFGSYGHEFRHDPKNLFGREGLYRWSYGRIAAAIWVRN